MKLIINIDEDVYTRLFDNSIDNEIAVDDVCEMARTLRFGTPLPKGCGRLGDLDFLAKRIKSKPPIGKIGKVVLDECYQEVLSAPTIIEADKVESEDEKYGG